MNLFQEYERLRTTFGWSEADLVACNLAAIRASFAPEELKTRPANGSEPATADGRPVVTRRTSTHHPPMRIIFRLTNSSVA